MIKDISDIITRKWRNKKLAPFYIIRPPLLDTNYDLKEWSESLLIGILKERYTITEKAALQKLKSGQSDILFIDKEAKKKQYTVENTMVEELFRMQSYSAKDLEHRFIFFNDAEDISSVLSNKLLKLLEEPKLDTTIFFLNSTHTPMLSTIESRAITLYLPNTQKTNIKSSFTHVKLSRFISDYFINLDIELPKEVIDSLDQRLFSEIIEYFTKKKTHRQHLIDALSNYMSSPSIQAQTKAKWLIEIQNYKKSEVFNNVYGERLFGLINTALHV